MEFALDRWITKHNAWIDVFGPNYMRWIFRDVKMTILFLGQFLFGKVYAGSEAEIVDFEELSEKAEEVEQADLEAKQAEFRENNPDVVADFRAKTEELFHSLDGQSADDIEKMVYAYVQSQIDEYGFNKTWL